MIVKLQAAENIEAGEAVYLDETENKFTNTPTKQVEAEATEPADDQVEATEPEPEPEPANEMVPAAMPATVIGKNAFAKWELRQERRFWAQTAVLGKIAECTENINLSEAEIAGFKAKIKDAKDLQAGETIRLRRLGEELRDILAGHPLPDEPQASEEDSEQVIEANEASEPEASREPDAWKRIPVDSLLDGVKGMGAKKREALNESVATLGDLEALRAKASKEHLHFSKVLPKGFGEALTDSLEAKMLEAIAKCMPTAAEQVDAEQTAEGKEVADQIEERERNELKVVHAEGPTE
jgi:hypothetical protein